MGLINLVIAVPIGFLADRCSRHGYHRGRPMSTRWLWVPQPLATMLHRESHALLSYYIFGAMCVWVSCMPSSAVQSPPSLPIRRRRKGARGTHKVESDQPCRLGPWRSWRSSSAAGRHVGHFGPAQRVRELFIQLPMFIPVLFGHTLGGRATPWGIGRGPRRATAGSAAASAIDDSGDAGPGTAATGGWRRRRRPRTGRCLWMVPWIAFFSDIVIAMALA